MRHFNQSAFGYNIGRNEAPDARKPQFKTIRGAKAAAYDRVCAMGGAVAVFQEGIGGRWYEIGHYALSAKSGSPIWTNT